MRSALSYYRCDPHPKLRRRHFLAASAAWIGCAGGVAAQESGKRYRIGLLSSARLEGPGAVFQEFFVALGGLGFSEATNLDVVRRSTGGRDRRFPELAAELGAMKVDVIVAVGSAATVAAKRATHTTPIVMVEVAGPVRFGLVASLVRPGGYVTGVSSMLDDIGPKFSEVIKEAFPARSRVAILWNPDNPASAEAIKAAPRVYKSLGQELIAIPVRGAAELEAAFRRAVREGAQVVSVHAALPYRQRVLALAAKHRLPVVTTGADWARNGAILSFGPDNRASARLAADYVARILKGANPADMPVQQPTKFLLVVNLKTAKELDIQIPEAILVRADEVIE